MGEIKCYVQCHKCNAQTEFDDRAMRKAGWDTVVFIRTEDSVTQTQLCPKHSQWWTLRYWSRRFNWRLGKLTHILSPGYSWCGRCLTSWDYVENHCTNYDNRGCFPLCEPCWSELTPEERLPYYRELYDDWQQRGYNNVSWETIKEAVLNE